MSSARILLAEDDADFRALVSAALRKADYRVVEASDGVDLAEQLNLARLRNRHDRPFDLVISDVRMPGRNGLEVLAGLQFHRWAPPVILVTAFGDRELHSHAERLGAAAVLDKPFDIDELRALVRRVLADAHVPTRAEEGHG